MSDWEDMISGPRALFIVLGVFLLCAGTAIAIVGGWL